MVMQAQQQTHGPLLQTVNEAWHLADLAGAYRDLMHLFEPALTGRIGARQSADAFYLRTFLIHEYRKILLRDRRCRRNCCRRMAGARGAQDGCANLSPNARRGGKIRGRGL